jgi:molybdopterin/thiamine biosynthesis adenylyltransferase
MALFDDAELRRYARQMVLSEVGGIGQERLRAAHARAQSEIEALYLAGAGVGWLSVPSEAIAKAARALNPLVEVEVQGGEPADTGVEVEAASLAALRTLKQVLGL